KDKDFFTQTIPYLQNVEKPYYAKLITLTNHFPFELDEESRNIEPFDSESDTLNNYFPTVRYMDEAIEHFIEELKLIGLYDEAIIIIMGDHDGISANHQNTMAQYLQVDEITAYDQLQLQRVPLFIHIPGVEKGEVISTISGQIDLKPTLLHLLGIDFQHDIYFGSNLFMLKEDRFIGFRNGNFVNEDYVYTNDTCYDRQTGEIVAYDDHFNDDNPCTSTKEQVQLELVYSDQIIYGDLFLFIHFYAK